MLHSQDGPYLLVDACAEDLGAALLGELDDGGQLVGLDQVLDVRLLRVVGQGKGGGNALLLCRGSGGWQGVGEQGPPLVAGLTGVVRCPL